MDKEGSKMKPKKSMFQIQLEALKKEFDKEMKKMNKAIKETNAINTKLIKQHQINTRRIQVLEKRLLQKDLDMNQLKGEISQLKSKLNRGSG